VSNEIVHEMDLFPTFAGWAGGEVPDDRIIDGVDQSSFFLGQQQESNRDSVVIYLDSCTKAGLLTWQCLSVLYFGLPVF